MHIETMIFEWLNYFSFRKVPILITHLNRRKPILMYSEVKKTIEAIHYWLFISELKIKPRTLHYLPPQTQILLMLLQRITVCTVVAHLLVLTWITIYYILHLKTQKYTFWWIDVIFFHNLFYQGNNLNIYCHIGTWRFFAHFALSRKVFVVISYNLDLSRHT